MKSKLVFAKAMLQTARLGAIRALDSATRDYATREEARWEKEVAKLEGRTTVAEKQEAQQQAA